MCRCCQSSGRCEKSEHGQDKKHDVKLSLFVGLGRCRVFCSSSFSLGRCLLFVIVIVIVISEGCACSSVLLLLLSRCPAVCPSVRRPSVRWAVMLSSGPAVSCSLLFTCVAVLLLRSAVVIFCYAVRLSYIVHNYAVFRHCKHLYILVYMATTHNNVKIYEF